MESLRQRLREQRAEEGLYLPRNCRRYQSYFLRPVDLGRTRRIQDTFDRTDSRVCRDTTNLIEWQGRGSSRAYSKMSQKESKSSEERDEARHESPGCLSSQITNESATVNPRRTEHSAHKSLENTNVTNEDQEHREYIPSRRVNLSTSGSVIGDFLTESGPVQVDRDKENRGNEVRPSGHQSPSGNRNGSFGSMDHRPGDWAESARGGTSLEQSSSNGKDYKELPAAGMPSSGTSKDREYDEPDAQIAQNSQRYGSHGMEDSRESDDSFLRARTDSLNQDPAEQMFLYLTHRELKSKIEALATKELRACTKHNWDDALRFRDARNRLELIREKKFYDTENFGLNADTRKLGLAGIDKREEELAQRENACSDSTMYSEDAKVLWNKWVHEDEKSATEDTRVQREILMSKLEEEWKNLAIHDKERITRSFQSFANTSSLQEEHKLAEAISAAARKSFPLSPE